MTYRTSVVDRLALYKVEHLKVGECGNWSGNGTRPHILPGHPEAKRLNILEPYRDDFWDYFRSVAPPIGLHRDFAHLNSSQAMCFNLFFPLVHEKAYPLLLKALGVKGEEADERESRFEMVLDEEESTNFDFHLRLRSGRRLLFEVKFTEQDFGTRKPSPGALKKAGEIYRPRLAGKVPAEYLEADRLFAHYQILRNMSYLDAVCGDHLFFVYPHANRELDAHRKAIAEIGSGRLKKCFGIIFLERMVARLRAATGGHDRLRRHYAEFAQKYMGRD